MSISKITSETQGFIKQRYEDTAYNIYRYQQKTRQQHSTLIESLVQRRQAFEDNATDDGRLENLQSASVPQCSSDTHVQSKVCVIV